MNQVKDKVAIVTGGGSGQGRATALALAAGGAKVLAIDVDEAGLAGTAKEAPEVRTRLCDVSKAAEVEAAVAEAEEAFGGLHAMMNCAAILVTGSFVDHTEEMWDRSYEVNVKGVFLGCKYAVPAMQRSGGGSIVNWGSANSMVAEHDNSAYCATKGAVLMLTKALALEYAKDDIRANCLCPSATRTPMVDGFFPEGFYEDKDAQREYQPLGLAMPEDIADVAVFLASDASRMMTGSAVMVDGGYTAM
ncbi:MAG: SDR family oxidoreductase [Actinobacteria bacterium]|nr:SDR family oxidoreductase [Actinomycetota bacterium]